MTKPKMAKEISYQLARLGDKENGIPVVIMALDNKKVVLSSTEARYQATKLLQYADKADTLYPPKEDIMEILKDCKGVTLEHVSRIFHSFGAKPTIINKDTTND